MRLRLESPVEGVRIDGLAVHVHGWAFAKRDAVRDVTILFDGTPLGRAGLARPRPDIAETLGDPRLGLCGFDRVVTLPPSVRTPGPHTVAVEARLLRGRSERTTPVRVELPAPPTVPEEPMRSPRPARDEGLLRGVWLADTLDHPQLPMAETVDHLSRHGWATTVLSPADGPLRSRLELAGADVRVVRPVPLDDPTGYRAAVLGLVTELAGADLAVAASATSFPLVHAAELAGVPAVQRIDDEAPLPTVVARLGGHLDAEVEAHARRAIGGAAAIWTGAYAVEASYREHGYDGRWHVIHHGRPAPSPLPDRADARRRLGLPEDRRVLVCPGPVQPEDGHGLLAEAARLVAPHRPELLVAMVGEENRYADLLRAHLAAHEMADTVRVAPSRDDLDSWWSAADAVALTSLVEGMSHGLPALATRTGDAAVLVEDSRSGWLAAADDLGSLVDALRRAADADEATWRAYGDRAATQWAQEDDRETASARVAALLERCAAPVRA